MTKVSIPRVFAASLCVLAALAQAQLVGGSEPRDEDARFIDAATLWMTQLFEVDARAPIDAPLREGARTLASSHVKRVPEVLSRWLAQERAEPGGTAMATSALVARVQARLVNELALWRLHALGTGFDEAWVAAMRQPTVCLSLEPHSYFTDLVRLWQAVPTEQRQRLLESETDLLARWGALPAPPARPAVEVHSAINEGARRLRGGGDRPRVPMPPVLAKHLLEEDGRVTSDGRPLHCVASQWWLNDTLADPANPRAPALLAWQYANMPQAEWWFPLPDAAGKKVLQGGYPAFAQRWEVQGSVVVEVSSNAAGQPQDARIVDRRLTVPGIRGVRPVAFETALDEASLVRAMSSARKPLAGKGSVLVELQWKLQ